MYSCSSCSWHQLSCCLPCLPNPESARLKLRGWNETRGAVGAADTFILSWLTQQPYYNSLLLWLTQWASPWHSSKCCCLSRWSFYMRTAHNPWPNEHLVRLACSATNDPSCYIDIIYKTWSEGAWTRHLAQLAVSQSPAASFFLKLLVIALCSSPGAYWRPSDLGVHLPVSNLFAFSYCPWGSPRILE